MIERCFKYKWNFPFEVDKMTMDYAERKEEEAKDAGKGRKIKEKGFQILDEAMCLLMLGMAGLVGMEANILT